MTYFLYILISGASLVLFLGLVFLEKKRGCRFILPALRTHLDRKIARMAYVGRQVDWGAFGAHITKSTLEMLAHITAHRALLFVRSVERFLTGVVRALRARRYTIETLPTEAVSKTREAVTFVRQTFRRTRRDTEKLTNDDATVEEMSTRKEG